MTAEQRTDLQDDISVVTKALEKAKYIWNRENSFGKGTGIQKRRTIKDGLRKNFQEGSAKIAMPQRINLLPDRHSDIMLTGGDMVKGFQRKNQLFSLCGLNCGLCPMLLGNYCGGCGNGNQSCRIAKCSLEHGKMEYCYECRQYPCEKYQHTDEYDFFITSRRRKADLEKAQSMGIEQYNLEQREKMRILSHLLSNYNDGRRKNFFCVAVNLLDLSDLKEAMDQIQSNDELPSLPPKEQCLFVVEVFQKLAARRNIELKLIRKK